MVEVKVPQRTIGRSVSDPVVAFQHVANEVLKETGGDPEKCSRPFWIHSEVQRRLAIRTSQV
jgi:hypothetical protein